MNDIINAIIIRNLFFKFALSKASLNNIKKSLKKSVAPFFLLFLVIIYCSMSSPSFDEDKDILLFDSANKS